MDPNSDSPSVDTQHPDEIAHVLATADNCPVRIYLQDGEATIPTGPCAEGSPPTETVSLESFDAVVKQVDIADGGETLWAQLHLSESEWTRAGFGTHWNAENADNEGKQRIIELWASRFDNYDDYDDTEYVLPIPPESPVIDAWRENDSDQETPPAPLERPTLDLYAAYATGVRDFGDAWNRVTVGDVATAVELRELGEWPEKRERPSIPTDIEPPSRHPTIDYDEIEPVSPRPEILDALFAINRHAKRLSDEADHAYATGSGAEARAYAIQKSALYDVKTIALHRIAKSEDADIALEKHTIDGGLFWCFSVGDYSFHQPVDAVADALVEEIVAETERNRRAVAIDFEASSDVSEADQSLTEALTTLSAVGINANEQLSQTSIIDYRWDVEQSITWESLPE